MAIIVGGALPGCHTSWRWVYYSHSVVVVGMLTLAMAFLLQETRDDILLCRMAQTMNKHYEAYEPAG